ncbi:MAG: hypothetical protein WD049_07665 [Candidatus Paceibacterota bacterium]
MEYFQQGAMIYRLPWATLIIALVMSLVTDASLPGAEPGPYEVIFYQDTNYTGLSDTHKINPTQAYATFRADDILATRHFIKSVKVGAKVGLLLGYDNYVAIAQPMFLHCPENRPNLDHLNWFVLSVIVYNRGMMSYPEGVMFGNHPTSQPPSARREMFVLANQTPPSPEVLARHDMKFAMVHGPASPAPPSANFDEPAETRLTIMHKDSAGVVSASVFGQTLQGKWQPHAPYDLSQSMDLNRIIDIRVTGSQRTYRQTSDGDDKPPGMKIIGLPPPTNPKLAPGGSPTDPLEPNTSPGGLSKIKPGQNNWKSSRGVVSLRLTPTVVSGTLTQTDGVVYSLAGWPLDEGVQLIVYNRSAKPIASCHFKESVDGKTASGVWTDLPNGKPQAWMLDRDQSRG